MDVILNTKPATFFTRFPIVIHDRNRKLFYAHPNPKRSIYFNLPPGKFYSRYPVHKVNRFWPYTESQLKIPFDFNLIAGENFAKATIFPEIKTVFFDRGIIANDFQPARCFVLLHEFAHLDKTAKKFKGLELEKYCDKLAAEYMLANGYNPSQISYAAKLLIDNGARCGHIKNNTTKKHALRS